MSVVYSNLHGVPGLLENRDYKTLGNLVTGLGALAHLELHGRKDKRNVSADVREVLNQLRLLIGPAWEEEGADIGLI